ncbi:hypothetical protein WMY93_032662, partial [Mugilogobius chulae]
VSFSRQPQNQTVTQGNAVRLGCAVLGLSEPDIFWRKDDDRIYSTDQMFLSWESCTGRPSTDQMFLSLGELHWETFYSVRSVQQQDGGRYWCEVESEGQTFSSEPAWITVEGEQVGGAEPSPSTLQVSGQRSSPAPRLRPPHTASLSGLRSHSHFSLRVSCRNQLGFSQASDWTNFTTPESVPMVSPRNLTFDLSDSQLTLRWRGWRRRSFRGNFRPIKFSGVWALRLSSSVVPRRHLWPGVLLGVLGASVLVLMCAFGAHRRSKDSHFGSAFKPVGSDSLVSFSAARSFNRSEPLEVNRDGPLGVSAELKAKLQDVLIPEKRLSLGHVLGKGSQSSSLDLVRDFLFDGCSAVYETWRSATRSAQSRLERNLFTLRAADVGRVHVGCGSGRISEHTRTSSTETCPLANCMSLRLDLELGLGLGSELVLGLASGWTGSGLDENLVVWLLDRLWSWFDPGVGLGSDPVFSPQAATRTWSCALQTLWGVRRDHVGGDDSGTDCFWSVLGCLQELMLELSLGNVEEL